MKVCIRGNLALLFLPNHMRLPIEVPHVLGTILYISINIKCPIWFLPTGSRSSLLNIIIRISFYIVFNDNEDNVEVFFEHKRKKVILDRNSARYVDVCVSCECKPVGIISVYDRVDFDEIKNNNLESVRLKLLSEEVYVHARNRYADVRDYVDVYHGVHHHTGHT